MPATPPSLKARVARIAPYFEGSAWGLAAVIAASVVGSATEPMLPALMKPLFDNGFKPGGVRLWIIPVAIIGLVALRGIAGFVAQYGLAWIANRGVLAMRRAMFDRLLNARPSLFVTQSASSLINTVTYDVQSGASLMVTSLLSLLKDSLTLIALFGYLLWLNWPLTIFVAVLFPTLGLTMRTFAKRMHRLGVANRQTTDQLAYVVEENVLAWRVVRLDGAGPAQAARFGAISDALRRLSIKSVSAAATVAPLTQLLSACSLSAVIVVALWQSGAHGGTVGSFVAFITGMVMVTSPVKHLAEVAGPLTRALVALERGVALVEETPVERGGSFDPGRARGALELRDVTLRFGGDAAPALDAVTLSLAAGESVALVGPSGAGKSTLVNLLPRFLEPSAGELRLDGTPLADWNMAALRRQFAFVSQDVVLLNATLADNVALDAALDDGATDDGTAGHAAADHGAAGNAAAGDASAASGTAHGAHRHARVEDALRTAHLLDFARALPQGLDTLVGHNGSQLSGGQRQRLAIARAVYKNAPILIFDEATSALDSESERLVQAALEKLMQGRTTVVVAHRLSTIERADRIVALDAGRIVEQGTHAELLARGGLYARLHALQFRT